MNNAESLSKQVPQESGWKASRLYLALLWHQHQPCYGDLSRAGSGLCFPVPWVRLHALRDYYSMAALVAAYPGIHLTISLTPILLQQIEDYAKRGATDSALELTRTPTRELTAEQREELQRTFFDADWHNEIYPHARYKELFDRRGSGGVLDNGDITDLRMWFNLAWFAPEFQQGAVLLPDGMTSSVKRFIEKARDFSEDDISSMIGEQFKIIGNVVAIHRQLQDAGQIEIATTPFYHPILPLLHDSDLAVLDRPGSTLPQRFAYPEDAEMQTRDAVDSHTLLFGRKPSGMWPAEGAVGESVIAHFRKQGVRWIASDAGVLRRSGEWGYEADRPGWLGKAWRAGSDNPDDCVSIFFRDSGLSDAVGFRYARAEPERAVDDFISTLKQRYGPFGDRIVSVILDGENAWGSYQQAGRPFFAELYRRLGTDPDICTVTFDEWLRGSAERGVAVHPVADQERVCKLAHASWIDEFGSLPGNDLGTWIGEHDENAGWDLLRETREALCRHVTPATHPRAFDALYAAEGSDWFWWYGTDQHCDAEPLFDGLFRRHLRAAYLLGDLEPPASLDCPLVPHVVTWSFAAPVSHLLPGDRLRFRAGCPGVLTWRTGDSEAVHETDLRQSTGVMAGLNVYTTTLGPFDQEAGSIEFQFQCGCTPVCHCLPDDLCCNRVRYRVLIGSTPPHRPSALHCAGA
jgi:alpha-amylase/alpha-mannosidase (GH57 family)